MYVSHLIPCLNGFPAEADVYFIAKRPGSNLFSGSPAHHNLLLQVKHAEYLVNLAPHPKAVTRAFRDLILAYGWRSVLCDALNPSVLICTFSQDVYNSL